MRTVYLGTSEFAAAVFRRLYDSPHRPALAVSRPDRPHGRGRKLKSPPLVDAARELGVEIDQPDSVNSDEARARISQAAPERVIVCAFGALIKEPLLSEHGPILNVHPSLLPRWRGAAPIERAILAGDDETGVSIMQLTAGLDSGPICLQEPQPINPDDDYGTLAARLAQQGADLLLRVLDDEAAGADPGRCADQDDQLATYADKLTADDRRLDPRQPTTDLANRVRALSPHLGAFLELPDATRLIIWRAQPVADAALPDDFRELAVDDRKLAKIVIEGQRPLVLTSDGALELLTVQPPGKNRMQGDAYARGHRPS